jgi:type IX secretion system substrate protein/List-Bact-rpt repeat protein
MYKNLQLVLIASVALLFFAATLPAAQRHWVGSGTGNGRFWDKTANWSLTQGGAGGAGVPTAADDVFIDGTGSMQINTAAVCLSFTQSDNTGTKDFTNNSSLTVGIGGITLLGGALGSTTTGNTITVAGNWTESGGSFSAGSALVVFDGTTTQTVTSASSFGALTINSSGGVTLASNLTATGALTLASGVVSTGASSLILASTGTLTRTGGWVNGNFQMPVATGATSVTYHVGDATNYTPVTVAFGNVTTAGNLTGKSTAGDHPNLGTSAIDGSKSVNRYFTLTNSGVVFTTYSATFNFVAGDVDGGANTANFIVGKFNSPNWTLPTVGTKTATSTQVTGLTTFSDFAIGEIKSLTITATAGANGSITPSGSVSVTYGASQSFTIAANATYHIADVLVDGVSQGAVTSYNFPNVTVNHTIAASFLADSVTITATAGANGLISPSGTIKLVSNGSQSFTITPDAHYHVSDVLVDGVSVGAVTNYSFTNVIVDHTIAASFAIDTDTITATAGANGSISPSGATIVNYGSDTTFTITPALGYHVADVLVDGGSIGAVSSHKFTNVIANHTISATFAIDTFTITASAGVNGSISPAQAVVNYGSDTTFTITPDAHYHVSDVLVDGSSIGAVASHKFTNVTANHTIAASFAIDTDTITATAGANGSISPSGAAIVNYGTDTTFTITPALGYHILDVLVDGVSVGVVPTYTFTGVIVNHTISASFAINTYSVVSTAGAHGAISPAGKVTVNYGTDQPYTLTPDTGYHVADILVDGVSAGATTSFTLTNITANHTVDASFAIDTLTITASAGAHGTITPSGEVQVTYGGSQSFTIVPDPGYHIAGVLVDGGSVGATGSYDFSGVTANRTISATFAINQFSVVALADSHGTISPSGKVFVDSSADQTFTITPDVGYFIVDVHVDTVSVGAVPSYTFTNVVANHTIEASFAIQTFAVKGIAGAHGTISPSGPVLVNYGSDRTFTITPDTGFVIADVHVDSVSVGAVPSYTFTNVTATHVIEASFAIQTFTVNAIADAHGSITPAGAVSVNYGSDQSFTMTPDTGYFVADVHVDSVSVGAVPSYTFTHVTANHVIEASFALQTFTINATAGPNGSVSPSGSIVLSYGADTSITITPDAHYHVDSLIVDGVSIGAVAKFPFPHVTGNHTLHATFAIDQVAITAISDGNGSLNPAGVVLVNYGSDQSFTITPAVGYFISDVHVDTVSVGPVPTYTFTNVTAPHVIEATFAIQTFIVKGIAGANGSISPSGAVSVNYGANQTFTITPDSGYFIADVHVDSVSVGAVPSYTFTNVTANHVIEANFALHSFTVFASAGAHGTISPSGAVPAASGGSLVFHMTPDSAYFVADVHVDSVSVGAVTQYTFTNILSDHTIQAFFDTHPLPQLKTISPQTAYRGQHFVVVVLTGANFVSGVSTLNAGTGITINSFNVHTSDTILANISVGDAIPPGSRSFTVTNSAPGGGTSGPVAFFVLNHPPNNFSLAEPLNGDTIKLKAPAVPIEFKWHPSADLDGVDTLKYIVILHTPIFNLVGVTTDTSFSSSSLMSLLVPQTDYTWNVLVTDGFDSVFSTQTFTFRTSDSVTAVEERGKRVPKEYALHQNYPNPFNPSTTIEFDLPHQSVVTLAVYNLLGQMVATLIDHRSMDIGYQTVRWDASTIPSGVYLYRISADGADGKTFVQVKKMMLMR